MTLPGCGPSTPEGPATPARQPDATYVTRGMVVQLPRGNDPRTQFKVKHEAIDNFADRNGKIVGMNAMIMEFPPARGVSLTGLAVGDPVEVTFSVWWRDTPPWLATKITKLPAGIEFNFGKADPSRATAGEGAAPAASPTPASGTTAPSGGASTEGGK
ncbi:MAG: copper-binding protein [Phycisphaerales bacterium]|jgi:hypothetical protein|nr:copper-binding protein [Phycisphaerales bacterium]